MHVQYDKEFCFFQFKKKTNTIGKQRWADLVQGVWDVVGLRQPEFCILSKNQIWPSHSLFKPLHIILLLLFHYSPKNVDVLVTIQVLIYSCRIHICVSLIRICVNVGWHSSNYLYLWTKERLKECSIEVDI